MFSIAFLNFDEADRNYDPCVDISICPITCDSHKKAAASLERMGYRQNPELGLWAGSSATSSSICHAFITENASAPERAQSKKRIRITITATFNISTESGSRRCSLGPTPLDMSFDTPEEAENFFQEKGYKPDTDNLEVMSKPLANEGGITGIALAVISQPTEQSAAIMYNQGLSYESITAVLEQSIKIIKKLTV